MRVPYRTFPGPDNSIQFYPLLHIRVGIRNGSSSRLFEALVDSGAYDCLFPEDVAISIGIKDISTGKKDTRVGLAGKQDYWIHPVVLYVGKHVININAAFTRKMPIAGILGRIGFFENFKVTFDPSAVPPGLEIERVNKA